MQEFIIKYWLEVAFGSAITILGIAYRKLKKRLIRQAAIEVGIQALLRDRIIQIHNHYTEEEYCPIYAKENIEQLYTSYKELGGNGTVKDLVDKLMGYPTELPERK